MKDSIPVVAMRLAFCLSLVSMPLMAVETPIVLGPPVTLDVYSKASAKSEVRYEGQPAKEGKIDLTASNGFFDRCFQALDPQPEVADDRYIRGNFRSLGRMSENPGTARWHLWCAEAGEIKATFFLQVPAAEAGHAWTITVGTQTQTLKANENSGDSPQKQSLTFTIKAPGKVTFTIDCTKNPPPAETRVHFIRLEGSAVNKASLCEHVAPFRGAVLIFTHRQIAPLRTCGCSRPALRKPPAILHSPRRLDTLAHRSNMAEKSVRARVSIFPCGLPDARAPQLHLCQEWPG